MTEDNDKPEAEAPQVEEKGEFGSAFSERASGAEQPAGDEPAKSEPAEAGSDAAPSDEAASDAPAAPAQALDPWEGLKPEQRSYFERLAASERSQRGRVGALTKKLNGAQRTAQPSESQPAERQPSTASGDEPSPASSIEARLEKLDAVAEEYGDINGPVVEELKALRAEINAIRPKVEEVDLDKSAYELEKAYVALEEKHSDWETVAGTPEFLEWAKTQPENLWAMVNSYDPAEVSLAITLYKTENGLASRATGEADEGANGSTATGDRRQRQLDGSKQVTTRGAPAATGVPNEYSAAFHARVKQQTQA
jgi:hypothetical protein